MRWSSDSALQLRSLRVDQCQYLLVALVGTDSWWIIGDAAAIDEACLRAHIADPQQAKLYAGLAAAFGLPIALLEGELAGLAARHQYHLQAALDEERLHFLRTTRPETLLAIGSSAVAA